MELFSKDGLLLMVQIDHLNGEIIGDVIEQFYQAGAKNVQVISSITKKNRPSYVVLIDTTCECADKLEVLIVNEYGSSGWHRIETCHRHTRVSYIKKQIEVFTDQETFAFTVEGKIIDDNPKTIRAEYDNYVKLRAVLLEKAMISIPLKELNQDITNLIREGKEKLIYGGSYEE